MLVETRFISVKSEGNKSKKLPNMDTVLKQLDKRYMGARSVGRHAKTQSMCVIDGNILKRLKTK